jgi:hypothetical protein
MFNIRDGRRIQDHNRNRDDPNLGTDELAKKEKKKKGYP